MKHNLKITEPDVRITIPAEQYGHFAEHLGRCIYGGRKRFADKVYSIMVVQCYERSSSREGAVLLI